MSERSYVFEGTQSATELERLRAIEGVFDPATRRQLLSTGLVDGWHCLEVGAGAGSIARWMSEQVGSTGRVVALDINTRFLDEAASENLEVVEGDIRTVPLETESFDLVHARYVLIHVPDWSAALTGMMRFLKPGGWLVVEEPDFSVSRSLAGRDDLRRGFDNVNRAIEAMFSAGGMDHGFGARIPGLLQERDLEEISVENDVPIARGGSTLAMMMRMSTLQLREKYLKTERATEQDIALYKAFASDPSCWGIYYATVRGAGRKTRR